MLASAASGDPTRFDHARDEVIELQEELPGSPVGIASFTDRVLPHLSPTVDQRVFRETMNECSRGAGERPDAEPTDRGQPPSAMPFMTLLAVIPLGVVLIRRNL